MKQATMALLLAALAAGCHKPDGPKDPELSDPFRPPPEALTLAGVSEDGQFALYRGPRRSAIVRVGR